MDKPKVGEDGWAWKAGCGVKETYPCKILEVNTDEFGYTRYFISYSSPALGRRALNSVGRDVLVKLPEKVVSYQLMAVKGTGYLECLGTHPNKTMADLWCRQPKHHLYTLFVQRTEVTGDKVEVFVERTLP
mgnify:CR=1 FL=1